MKILLIFVAAIFGIPTILYLASDITGIGSKEEGYRVYEALSDTKDGQDLIKKYNIKCVAKDVETVAFIDMSRGETFFAYNVNYNDYYVYENIKYTQVPEDVAKQYHLTAHFGWLNTYGRWIFYGIFIICASFVVIAWLVPFILRLFRK